MNTWDRIRQDTKFRQKLLNAKSTLPKISQNSQGIVYKKKNTYTPSNNNNRIKTAIGNSSEDSYRKQSYLKHLLSEFGLSQYLRKFFDLGYDDSNLYRIGKLKQKDFDQLLVNLKVFPGHQVKMMNFYEYLKQLSMAKKLLKPHTSTGNKRITSSNKRVNTLYNTTKKQRFSNTVSQRCSRPCSYNNKMVNSFMNGDFGYTYYLNDNNNMTNINSGNNISNLTNNFASTAKSDNPNFYGGYNKNYNISNNDKFDTPYLNENNNNDEAKNNKDESPAEDIDKMLKYYMIQLNEKLDDSYDSIEDSSLSHIILNDDNKKKESNEPSTNKKNINNTESQFSNSEATNIKSNNNKNDLAKLPSFTGNNTNNYSNSKSNSNSNNNNVNSNNVNPPICNKPIKLPSINKSQNSIHNSSTKVKEYINSGEHKSSNEETSSYKEVNKNETSSNKIKTKDQIESKTKNSAINQKEENNTNNTNNNNQHNQKEKEILKSNQKEKQLEDKKEEKDNEDYSSDGYEFKEEDIKKKEDNNIDYSSEAFEFKEEDIEVKEESNFGDSSEPFEFKEENAEIKEEVVEENDYLKKKTETEENPLLENNIKSEEVNTINKTEVKKEEEKENKIQNNVVKAENKKEEIDEAYTKEQMFYENLRLNKSSEGDYLRQNLDQFDIEYMCRCLGLAIMKHIESGKDKQHITDLLDNTEKFSFFNSLYNSKFEFIFNFFNKTNNNDNQQKKMSNLDKLDYEEYQQNKKNEKMMNKENISFVNHIKKRNDEDLIKKADETDKFNKFHSNFSDIEKDIKFIDEFFSVGARKKNYQDLSVKTREILNKELSYINEVSGDNSKLNSTVNANNINNTNPNCKKELSNNLNKSEGFENLLKKSMEQILDKLSDEDNNINEDEDNYDNEFNQDDIKVEDEKEDKKETEKEDKKEDKKETEKEDKKDKEIVEETMNNKFSSLSIQNKDKDDLNNKNNPVNSSNNNNKNDLVLLDQKIKEEIPTEGENEEKEVFESGEMESNYVIDASTVEKLKDYLLKQAEIYDDDYFYPLLKIQRKKYVPPPDPQQIFDFCANIMILTKMEKEVIIITLIYLERFIFNTGLLITNRNWRRITFTAMIISSKIWDDDSFENNHFAQVFTHLKIGEINLLERTFLELISYKVYVKCSEYFKYFFIIKSIALKYNFNGMNIVPISVERMMKIQEYAFQMQKKMRKKYSLNNSI